MSAAGFSRRDGSHSADIEQALNRLDLFSTLNAGARELILRHGITRSHGANEVLWLAGDTAQGLHIILDGSVRIMRGGAGRQHVVHAERAGATIGEVPLFDEGQYPATAITVTPTRCLFLPRDVLQAAMAADPGLAWALLARLGRRVRVLVDRLHSATLLTVRSRLAGHLLENARTSDTPRRFATLGGTQTEVAEQLGTVREVVARELARLRRKGLIAAAGRGRYEILDVAALERLLADPDDS